MNWLTKALDQGPFLLDGAMGSMLFKAGLKPGECAELWNVEQPEKVRAIHKAYLSAGSMAVTANTFGGTPDALARHGLETRCEELNAAAVSVARGADAQSAFRVLGDLGPFGGFLEPLGETTLPELKNMFDYQIGALHEAGADGIIIETMSDPQEAATAVHVARGFGDWPVLATLAFQKAGEDFRTMMGSTVPVALGAVIDAGADVVGANCGTGLELEDYLRLAEALVAAAGPVPVILQPNAGAPKQVDGAVVYPATPEQMGAWAKSARDAGVKVIGGCCGTTPEHLKAMAEALKRTA
ncbi:MAG: homocysteine S-methyltransferase family protein [Armatimonadetes bacterium]|nr:homocysteine S-methyltransferase family protein [Armatimonadota bacterium]